jgi:hypothetical protein
MKTKDEAIEFIKYVEKQSRYCGKYEGFDLQDWLNQVLLANEGYEDYFIVLHEDRPEDSNVGLYRYSDFDYRSSPIQNK